MGALTFLILSVLPGAWVTFGAPLRGFGFWSRLLTGVALTPPVLCSEFYALRLAGVSFESSAALLPWLNLPAVFLIARRFDCGCLPNSKALLGTALVLLAPLGLFFARWTQPAGRAYSWHAWMHSDIVSMIANGHLMVGEPEMAGVRLAYPWLGHAYQAVLSYQLDSPPAWNFIWVNLVWLLTIYGLTALLVGELRGNRFSKVTSVIWLFFGVNIVGYVLLKLLPLSEEWPLWGDRRYTPWFEKLFVLNQMPLALGMFLALAYVLLRREPHGFRFGRVGVASLLVLGIVMIYPLYLPVVCAFVGGFVLAVFVDAKLLRSPAPYRPTVALAAATLIAAGLAWVLISEVTADRVAPGFDVLPSQHETVRKALQALIVTSPLLAGVAVALPRVWRRNRVQALTLLWGGAASGACYVVFRIPDYANEYKFVFTAALCLFPFLALALEPLFERLGRLAAPVLGVVILLVIIPARDPTLRSRSWTAEPLPRLDVSGFDLRLDGREPFARLCDVIREQTPIDSILVTATNKLHLPTLTRRQLYVAPATSKVHPGVDMTSDFILTRVRGYDEAWVRSRQRLVTTLVSDGTEALREEALDEILTLGRPLVFVVDEQAHSGFLAWLARKQRGYLLVKDAGLVAWLIDEDGR